MSRLSRLPVLALCASVLCACPPRDVDDGGPAHDAGTQADGGADGGAPNDGGPHDGGPHDGGGPLDGGADEGAIDNPWGFAMRVPQQRDIECEEGPFSCPDGVHPATDVDYVCTLSLDGHEAVVYLRATPTSILTTGFPYPAYDDVRAFVAEGGRITEVEAAYDYGGNHHNDFFHIELEGVRYTWDHSSYGFGFRACQPPDCLRREAGDDYTDGCQPERTLPEACIAVADPLPPLVDNFMICEGDEE